MYLSVVAAVLLFTSQDARHCVGAPASFSFGYIAVFPSSLHPFILNDGLVIVTSCIFLPLVVSFFLVPLSSLLLRGFQVLELR